MTTQEINNKATKMIELGTEMTFEEIVAMYTKREKKSSKKSKRNSNAWNNRKSVNEVNVNISSSEGENYFEEQREIVMNRFNK